ncbi:MAG: acetyl-CoA carboxylase biotin carboxyl carrier protein [Rhodospirillales bacterium]|nr:acetyl-CoA carboxylase biotin carboxyl carrier protein [Alphaproteobacteria bacterium]MBL6948163.1 acetyl-CoA carboxylase biotin carboxyl carrier protein [Rhodospirillales bacterium]
MANKPKRDVDEDLVRQLAKLLEETNLAEIEFGRDDWHVRVVKAGVAAPVALPLPPAQPAGVAAETSGENSDIDLTNAVTSPMVGVVFTSSEPGADPFVKVGDQVKEGQTLLLIEAMKVFNPITATRAGKVTRILITSGDPVEFGEPLLILE